MRKQELIFALLKNQAAKRAKDFRRRHAGGLPDGFGFLRSPDTSYLASTDDIYVSRRRSAASTCTPATPSKARSARRRTASATLRWSRWTRSTAKRRRPEEQDPVREPDAAASERAHDKLERDIKAKKTSPAASSTSSRRSARASAACSCRQPEERQDGDDAAHRACHHANHPDSDPDRAADRRAPGRSDRNAAHGARRSGRLDLRRTGHPPRAGRRNGDREGQAAGRTQEGRGHPARLDHPPGARLQHRAAGLRQGAHRRRRRQRAAEAQALLRRRPQHRGRRQR
jgi:hypothetical protein